MEEDLTTIIHDNHQKILDNYSEGSFPRLFWQTQITALNQSKKSSIRWHPSLIKWCIFLKHKSSSAYELLRKSGFVQLPSQRTLRDYTHYYTTTSGFSTELDHPLVRDSAMSSLKEYQHHICLIGDEMYIKEDLVYSKSTGELVGFRDIGDINQHLLKLEHEVYGSQNNEETLATTMMVFMVRGLFTGFTFPYATFPATNLTGDQLIPLYLECTFRLERCGFRVTCVTLDGHSVNRRFFKLLGSQFVIRIKV